MFLAIAAWAFFAFTACGDSTAPTVTSEDTPRAEITCDVDMHVKQFTIEAHKRSLELSINPVVKVVTRDWFLHSSGCNGAKTIACGWDNNVRLLDTYWSGASCYQREQTLFHELGHAIFSMPHVQPLDMMQPYAIRQDIYSDNRASILDRFFLRARLTGRRATNEIWQD
jgi:hypothetical protein